jgi:hypothetical protein
MKSGKLTEGSLASLREIKVMEMGKLSIEIIDYNQKILVQFKVLRRLAKRS